MRMYHIFSSAFCFLPKVCCYDIALRDCSDCRNNADKRSGISYIYDSKRKGQDKNQSSGDLVDNGMDCCQRVPADESDNDIDKLDKRDHAYPYNDPQRQSKDRQELYQYNCDKNDIGKGVKLRAEFGCGIRFPRDESIKYIR